MSLLSLTHNKNKEVVQILRHENSMNNSDYTLQKVIFIKRISMLGKY